MGLFVGVCVWVCCHDLEIVCINPHQTGSVGKGNDHIQLIKFWPSCASGKGVCGRGNVWLRLTTASAVFASTLSTFFIVSVLLEQILENTFKTAFLHVLKSLKVIFWQWGMKTVGEAAE